MARKTAYRNLSLAFLLLGLIGYFSAPAFPGFTIIPLSLAFLFFLAAGAGQWRRVYSSLFSLAGRSYVKAVAALLLSLILALAAGQARLGRGLDFSGNRAVALAPETLALLERLDRPVSIKLHLGPQSPGLERVKVLMDLYLKGAGGKLKVSYINPQTESGADGQGPRLAAPGAALMESEGFRESLSPISEDSLNNALNRLMHPERRLIYFLNTFGEKMVQDKGPGGLSQLAADLSERRLLALDYYWPEEQPLPREASILALAGPKAPLGQRREQELLDYVRNGGYLLIMADPLVAHISPDFWAVFGLKYPHGLVLDPEATLAGTKEAMVVSHDYPRHALTLGLDSPSVWPISGAFIPGDNEGQTSLQTTIFAVAMSSSSSWLETDALSYVKNEARYQAGQDIPGPLALAVAAEMGNGGRLLALADSDLAANGFQGFPGNRNFNSAAVSWLLDGESAVPIKLRDESGSLALSPISARLLFWLPVVLWPALVILLWLAFYFRRHSRRRQLN